MGLCISHDSQIYCDTMNDDSLTRYYIKSQGKFSPNQFAIHKNKQMSKIDFTHPELKSMKYWVEGQGIIEVPLSPQQNT